MPPALALRIVLERGAGVKADMVVEKLHIARLELVGDVEALVIGDSVEQVERLDLRERETRHFGEALGVDDLAADVAAGGLAVLPSEDRGRIVKGVARAVSLGSGPQ